MDFDSITSLRDGLFLGFESISSLRASRCAAVPKQPGIYVIVREPTDTPTFLTESPAGWHKGKNPNMAIESLQDAWVHGSCVVYIGKAGGAGTKATLRTRLSAYFRQGQGARAGHWGGRAIWQLQDSQQLLVAWQTLETLPRKAEESLIAQFAASYNGQRPFANRAV